MIRRTKDLPPEQRQRRAERTARGLWWAGWLTWPAGAFFAGTDVPAQFIIGLSEVAIIYTAWTALQVVDPEVG